MTGRERESIREDVKLLLASFSRLPFLSLLRNMIYPHSSSSFRWERKYQYVSTEADQLSPSLSWETTQRAAYSPHSAWSLVTLTGERAGRRERVVLTTPNHFSTSDLWGKNSGLEGRRITLRIEKWVSRWYEIRTRHGEMRDHSKK